MFDLRTQPSSNHGDHPQRASSQPATFTAIAAMDLDDDTDRDALVTMVSGCDLLDGIRHGITSHGWTLPEHQIRQLPGSSR